MSIVESDGPPSWSLDVSETVESTKCLWVGVMGLKVWGWEGGKNRETVTASLCLVFTALDAPATATPDWFKGQYSSSEHSRSLTTPVTESDNHYFATQAKIASISEQNVLIMIVSVCFLSWRIGVKREQKDAVSPFTERFSNLWIQFNTNMYFQKVC